MNDDRPEVPFDALRAMAADHPEAAQALDAFHAEYHRNTPDRAALEAHADRLRGFPSIVAPFERWWLNPRVQAFVAELNATGL